MKRILTLIVGLCLLFSLGCGEDIVIQGDSRSTGKPQNTAPGQKNNGAKFKEVMMGLHNYHDTFGSFPPPYLADESGKPMHSWRVLLLPLVGEKELYKQYDLNQPWNSEHNQKVSQKIPEIYQTSGSRPYTTIQAIVGPKTIFDPTMEKVKMTHVTDGLSNTICLVENVNNPVLWTKPEDISINDWIAGKTFENLGTKSHITGVADGSIKGADSRLSRDALRNLAERDDGNPVY